MYQLTPIPVLNTNYIWHITSEHYPGQAVIVDPGESAPVLAYLQAHQLNLAAILVTHHHKDHTAGIEAILQHHPCAVYAGYNEPVQTKTHSVKDGEICAIDALDLHFTAIHVPGHTDGHIAYYGHEMLFSGDTLFAAGCGRNFEGTATQLYSSLQKLMQLPKETQLYCGHEYTEQNLTFGMTVETDNSDIRSKLNLVQILRKENHCTLPSSLAEELNTNVFLRCDNARVKAAAEKYSGNTLSTEVDVFTTLRHWKNLFYFAT